MYLSTLLIDTGTNPDRPRPGRLWLRNVYHVHQRLSMAFPKAEQEQRDPHFLQPFIPSEFESSRFLFRIDNRPEDDGSRTIILVQSNQRPNWDYAFQNAQIFLAAAPQLKEYNPTFEVGQNLRFRIRMNLSKKSQVSTAGVPLTKSRGGVDAKGRERTQSKRISLIWDKDEKADEVVEKWFAQKGNRGGFELKDFRLLNMGTVTAWKNKHEQIDEANGGTKMTFRSGLLEGALSVVDATAFAQAVSAGIGPAKAFGFGLLSVAPV